MCISFLAPHLRFFRESAALKAATVFSAVVHLSRNAELVCYCYRAVFVEIGTLEGSE
jgi:hypothetical protein